MDPRVLDRLEDLLLPRRLALRQVKADKNFGSLPELDHVDDLLAEADREADDRSEHRHAQVGDEVVGVHEEFGDLRPEQVGGVERKERGKQMSREAHRLVIPFEKVQRDEERLVAEAENEEGDLAEEDQC